jgi:hypothetical protein
MSAASAAPRYWRLYGHSPDRTNRSAQLPTESASVHDFPTRVRLTSAAHRELLRLLRGPAAAGIECGGAFFGTFDHGMVKVRHVHLADKPRSRRTHSVELDLPEIDGLVQLHKGEAELCGLWRLHPSERGVPWPSPADLRSWRAWLDDLDGRYLGVVINRSLIGTWDRPQATGFLMTSGRSGADVQTLPVELPDPY